MARAGMHARAKANNPAAGQETKLCSPLPSFSNPRYYFPILMTPAIFYDRLLLATASAVKIGRCSLSNARIPTPKWSKFVGNLSLWTRVFFLPMGGLVAVMQRISRSQSLERQVGMCRSQTFR